MNFRFDGKLVVIAGGTKGIGLATARRFGALGARVVVGARSPSPDIEDLPFIEFVACNMADPKGPDALIDRAKSLAPKIDVLINSVGGAILRPEPAAVTDEQWMEMLNRSFLYAVRTCRAAVPYMTDNQGAIINISSVTAQVAEPTAIDYGAAKAALDSFSKSLATTLAPRGIRVNVISPGVIATPLWTAPNGLYDQFSQVLGMPSGDIAKTFAAQIPLARLGDAEEIAGLVVFMATPDAGYMTGASVRVDGGWLASVR